MERIRAASGITVRFHHGVVHASLIRLCNRLKGLEAETGEPKTLDLALRMSQKLSDLDSEFRTHHHTLIDLIDDEYALAKVQEVLDTHDDLVAELSVRVRQVIAASSPSSDESSRRITFCKLTHLQKSLAATTSIICDTSTTTSDMCLLRQYEETTNDKNRDLAKTRGDLHRMELDETVKLFELQDTLERDCSVNIKQLLSSACCPPEALIPPPESKGVRLPTVLHFSS